MRVDIFNNFLINLIYQWQRAVLMVMGAICMKQMGNECVTHAKSSFNILHERTQIPRIADRVVLWMSAFYADKYRSFLM